MIDPARVRALAAEMENDPSVPPMSESQAEQVIRVLGSRPAASPAMEERASASG